MKKLNKMTKGLLLLTMFLGWGLLVNAQPGAPPPPPGNGHGQTGNQSGGSAPIGGGLAILLSMGAAYGGRKVYKHWQTQKEDLEE